MKLLITDLQFRKSFDIFNICQSKGYEILALHSGGVFEKIILPLVYLQRIHTIDKKENFEKLLTELLKKEKIVYFPIEENTTEFIYEFNKTKPENPLYYNLPPQEAFDMVKDKGKFSTFCQKNGIAVPKEYIYDKLLEQGEIPSKLIVKPRRGSGSMGIQFIDTYEELDKLKDLDFSKHIIQERLDNSQDIEGAFFLFNKGKFISYYGHERIRTYPPEGGVTVYSKVKLNQTLKLAGIELLEKLDWSGIAMVEFLYDHKDKTYKVIEVNPRAWGSIMLSEFCGANLISDYIKTSIGEKVCSSEIKEECYIRWCFPWDFLLYFKHKGNIPNFWSFETTKTCYINISYTSWYRSFLYTTYNIFDISKINKFVKKVFNR
ncbi:MAG: Unknown protein [uncultured Sulfurovum sp.]|uniref:ATP-grasp domain-containing protein n=1 Tax=uncultured Sulfurovum sp. TaxID=269237 RepID=A0A6S6TZ02_9BACT|nr:MAG: Unknown protein [uncultured Sulfurovum sp.]